MKKICPEFISCPGASKCPHAKVHETNMVRCSAYDDLVHKEPLLPSYKRVLGPYAPHLSMRGLVERASKPPHTKVCPGCLEIE